MEVGHNKIQNRHGSHKGHGRSLFGKRGCAAFGISTSSICQAVALAMLVLGDPTLPHTSAATYTWNGGGGNVNFTTAANWTGGAPTSSAATDLIFSGTTNIGSAAVPLNQNISTLFGQTVKLDSITFNTTAGAFFLGGNKIEFGSTSNQITQSSASDESIVNAIAGEDATLTLNGTGTGLVTLGGIISDKALSDKMKLVKSDSSRFLLTGVNTYTSGTDINGGTLIVGHANALGTSGTIKVNSGATLAVNSGITFTRAITLNSGAIFGGMGTYTPGSTFTLNSNVHIAPGINGIGTLAIGNSTTFGAGSILDIGINGAANDLLKVTGTLNTASSTNKLALTMTSPTLGKYKIADFTTTISYGTNLASNGYFGTVTGLDSAYRLVVVTGANGEIDVLHKATIGTITATPAAATIITGGATAFTFTVANSAPTNSSSLAFSAASGTNTTGSVAGPVSAAAQATSGATSGLTFNGTTVGLAQSGQFTVTDAAASNSPQTGTVSVNVLGHSTAFLSLASGNNQTIISGGSLGAVSLNLTDVGSNLSGLDVNTLSNLSGATGANVVANNATGSYTATGFDTVTVGLNKTLATSLKAGDQQGLSGASALATLSQNVTYNVLGHSAASASVIAGDNFTAIVGATGLSGTIGVTNTAAGPATTLRVNATPTIASGSLSDPGTVLLAPNTSQNYSFAFNAGGSAGAFSNLVTFTAGDDQSIPGHGALASVTTSISGTVLNHAVPSLSTNSIAFGNVLVGTSASSSSVNLQNAAGTYRADLVLTAINGTGNSATLTRSGSASGSIAAGGSLSNSIGLVTTTAGTYNANYAYDVEDQNLSGGLDRATQNLAVSATVYDRASITANTALILGSGSNVLINNASAAPLRSSAFVHSYSISSDWTLNNLGVGSWIAPGSGTPNANVTHNDTGLLNGVVNSGTLSVALENNQAFTGAASQDLMSLNWSLSNKVSGQSGEQSTAVGLMQSYVGLSATSNALLQSIATILAGSNDNGPSTRVATKWRNRTPSEQTGTDSAPLRSDVLALTGTSGDRYVLHMDYQDSGTTEAAQTTAGHIYLAWLDGVVWKNAVAGNIGANTTNPAFLNYQGPWDASGAGLTLGAWGVYTASNSVWAVLNHNSDFAVAAAQEVLVPEPSAIVLALSGLVTLGCFVRWRGRRRP